MIMHTPMITDKNVVLGITKTEKRLHCLPLLPLYAVFGFLFYETNSLQNVSDIINSALLPNS